MFIRLNKPRTSDCCAWSQAFVYDTDLDRAYCVECWGKRLQNEHPQHVISERR